MCDCRDEAGPAPVTDWACGDVVCMRCGVVMEGHIMDEAPEWRTYRGDDQGGGQAGADRCRVGAPTASARGGGALAGTYLDMGRGQLPGRAGEGRKARRLAAAAAEPQAAGLREGLRAVDEFVAAFRLSTTSLIGATARELFEDAHEARATRSDTRRALAAAALYFACKLENTGRELRQVSDVCGVDLRTLNAATVEMKALLAGKPYHARLHATLQAGKLLDIFLDRLALATDDRRRVWRAAQALDGRLSRLMDCGRKPRTICSGLLWVAVQDEAVGGVGKKDVTAACAVCQQTLDKVTAQIRAALVAVVV